jgi:putative sigma-54 modulation protein
MGMKSFTKEKIAMGLKVDIFTRNMEVTDRINDYVTKKVSKLDRFLMGIDEARVDLDFNKSARSASDRQVAQITIRGKGYILRSEERADDIFAAVDAAIDKIQRQIERFKGKRARGRGDGTPASEVATPLPEPEKAEEMEPVIARRKHFTLVPMDEMEAIDQMILLGHEAFFVFYNANSNAINVLYRRRDGTYGLIEPEIG